MKPVELPDNLETATTEPVEQEDPAAENAEEPESAELPDSGKNEEMNDTDSVIG